MMANGYLYECLNFMDKLVGKYIRPMDPPGIFLCVVAITNNFDMVSFYITSSKLSRKKQTETCSHQTMAMNAHFC